jgi:pilus assembly protein CpaB
MNIRTIATLAVALFLGLIATLLVKSYIGSGRPASNSSTGVTAAGATPVVVAALPIARGAPLDLKSLKVVTYPATAVPAGAFHSVAEMNPSSRRALRPMTVNEPILADQVTGAGGRAGLSRTLADGMRAIAVRSNDVVGVGGFALPGDRVDILVTRPVGKGDAASTVTQLLAANVRLLAVDQTDDTDKPVVTKSVTVEVTPEQAQTISLAQSVGTVSFALRSAADDSVSDRRLTTVADLGGERRAAASPRFHRPSKPVLVSKEKTVRVTRGVETTGYSVDQF